MGTVVISAATTQKEGMGMRKFIYLVLISLTGLIGCVGMDGGKGQIDRGDRSVLTQSYDFEGTGATDYTSEL